MMCGAERVKLSQEAREVARAELEGEEQLCQGLRTQSTRAVEAFSWPYGSQKARMSKLACEGELRRRIQQAESLEQELAREAALRCHKQPSSRLAWPVRATCTNRGGIASLKL